MADLGSGALPIGLLMFVGTALAFVLRKSGHRNAIKDFPGLAPELGLRFVPPRYRRAQGSLSGEIRGYRVSVDPDEQHRILVRFKVPPSIDFRSYEHSLRAPFGMATVYTKDRRVDRFFRTRFAAEPLATLLAESDELGACIEPFQGEFARQIRALTVTSEAVTCSFDFGNPQHIPAAAVRALLPACVGFAEVLEALAEAAKAEGTPEPLPLEGDDS